MRRPLDRFRFISSTHGQPTTMGFYGKHLGTDYATGVNTPVYAPCNAVVSAVGSSVSVGTFIELKESGNGQIHRLFHLNQEFVSTGQQLSEGQLIAMSGQTGTNITGPHLHWDVRRAGTAWNAGFANYYNPEALIVVAPPKPDSTVTPDDVGKTVYLSATVSSWRVYRIGTTTVVGRLNPAQYGGLSYRILAIDTSRPQMVVIQTQFYGRVSLPVDTDAQIK